MASHQTLPAPGTARRLHTWAALAVLAIAALVLLGGWWLGIERLTYWAPNAAAMKPNTAIAFLLCGASLWCLRSETPARRRIARAAAAAALLLAGATLVQYIGGWNFGIDELPFRDPVPGHAMFPGRMSITTAVCFVLLASALLLLDRRAAEALAGLALVPAVVSLVGRAYGSDAIASPLSWHLVSLPTALAFLLLGIGVLAARPRRGMARYFASGGPEGVLVRRTLLAALALIAAVTTFAQLGRAAGLYGSSTHDALELAAELVGMVVLLLWAAATVARLDAQRQRGVEDLKRSEERLRLLGDNLPDSAIYQYTHDADGSPRFLYISAGIERLTGVSVPEAMRDARALLGQIAPEWSERYLEAEARSLRELSRFEIELPMCRRDGQLRWMRLRSLPRRLPDGRVVWDGMETDITERKQGEQALRESEERATQAVAVARLGILEVDHRDGSVYWSPRLREIAGWAENEPVVESGIRELIPPPHRAQLDAALQRAEDPASDGMLEMEHPILRRDGELRWVNVHMQTTFDGVGPARHSLRRVAALADITERMRLQDELRAANVELERRVDELKRTEDRLSRAVAVSRIGLFEREHGEPAYWSPRMREIVGVGADAPGSREGFIELVDAEHRDALRAALENSDDPAGDGRFAIELPLRRPDGGLCWVDLRGHTEFAGDGAARRPVRTVGTIADISDAKRTEQQLRDANAGLARALGVQRLAQAVLRERTELLAAITDNSPDLIFAKDREHRVIFANPAALATTGKQAHELLGRRNDEWAASPELALHLTETDLEAMSSGRLVTGDELIGDRIFQSVKGPLRDGEGRVAGTFGIARDVTESRSALDALRLSEERKRQAVEVARLGLFEVNYRNDGALDLYWSPRMREIVGWSADEPASRPGYRALIPASHRHAYVAAVLRAEQPDSDGLYEIEHPIVRRDGQLRWVNVRGQTTFDGAGAARRPLRAAGAIADVTETRRALEAARLSEERTRQAVEVARLGLFEVAYRDDGELDLYWSPRMREIIGWGDDEPPSRPGIRALIPQPHRDAFAAAAARAESAEGDGLYEIDLPLRRRDGELRWVHVRGQVMFDGAGAARRPLRAVGALADITERRQAEEALRESEGRFRTLFETMSEGFCLHEIVCDEAGKPCDVRHLAVNPAYERQLGRKAADLVGSSVYEMYPDTRPFWIERYGKVALTGAPAHFEAQFGPFGRWFDISAYRTQPGRVAVVFSDITERRQAEKALRASEQRLRLFLESVPGELAIFDRDMRYLEVSRRWLHDYRLDGDVIGRSHYEVFPELPQKWKDEHRRAFGGAVISVAADRFERADGTIQWLRRTVQPWHAADGEVGGLIIATEDITDRKRLQDELHAANVELEHRVEQRTLELAAKALELERLSRVKSEFLANMSHELRTPLCSLLILAQLLEDNAELNLSERQVSYAHTIHGAGKDLLQLIDDILDLAKIEAGKVELEVAPVALAGLCDELERMFHPLAAAKAIVFEVALDAATPQPMETDARRLRQIVKNLLSNALKFTASGSVRLAIGPADSGWPEGHAALDRAARVVALSVQDSGIGIPPDKQSIIFDAFRQADGSTARQYGGTGLGLAISRELAQMLGGALTVQSTPGQGSRFTLWLPAAFDGALPRGPLLETDEAQPAAPASGIDTQLFVAGRATGTLAVPAPLAGADAPASNQLLAGKTVLLVDDDMRNLFALAGLLEQYGIVVVVAESGQEALDQLAARPQIELVLMDIMMPGMDGYQATRAIRADPARARLPVIALTAKAMKGDREKCLEAGASDYLSKPVEPARLLDLLRVWLGP